MFSTRCDVSAVTDWVQGGKDSGKLGAPAPSKLRRLFIPSRLPSRWKALFSVLRPLLLVKWLSGQGARCQVW